VEPSAAISEHVISELGIAAPDLVVVDDTAVDVDGAIAVGGAGHVSTDAAALESWLRELAA
jgi:putative hydrolase of the HAD superfamily